MDYEGLFICTDLLDKGEIANLASDYSSSYTQQFTGFVVHSSNMRKFCAVVRTVAPSGASVVISGETGTGKELVARALHEHGKREGKFVPVNCGALSDKILESELFGHEKGAFTGATDSRVGCFVQAHRGTIFLDEVADMSPALQVRLLRVLQESKVKPLGSDKSVTVDLRVVAATNKNLKDEVKAGRFRADLFYRLNVVALDIPPLRNRREDVVHLVNYFLELKKAELGRSDIRIDREAVEALAAFNWPGNVRQLKNVIENLCIFCEGDRITLEQLPERFQVDRKRSTTEIFEDLTLPPAGVDFKIAVTEFERHLIGQALDKSRGNKKKAAEFLGLKRTTLVEKLRRLGL